MKSIDLSTLKKELKLDIIYKSKNYDNVKINTPEFYRPGLPLAGFLERFPKNSIMIMGIAEYNYYNSLSFELRCERFADILKFDIPAIIFSHNIEPYEEMIDIAKKYDKTIFKTFRGTTKLITKLEKTLEYYFAPETTMHSGLMEVYGMGVLIMGDSAIGKSETELELITKGHRLVADDVTEIKRIENELIGKCQETIRHFLEIRGIGIIDIKSLYGVGAIKESVCIDLVISLEEWDDNKEYDRVGIDEDYINILGVNIPKVTIPVKPGRNISMIVEVATMIRRQRKMGYNAAEELNNRLIESLKR